MATNRYPGFSAESKGLIFEAEALGWTFRVTKGGHAFGRSPDGTATINIPRNLSRANRSQQNCEADLRRWQREQEGALGKAVEVMSAIRHAPKDPILDGVMVEGMVKHLEHADQEQEPTLVSEKPWMARKGSKGPEGGGRLYESQAVIERRWSDGTRDYLCAFPDCDYTAPDPRSVATHYGRTNTHRIRPGSVAHPPTVYTPVYEESGRHRYRPTERLLLGLAEALRESGATDPTGYAYAALQWIHDRPDLIEQERQPREPWTAEQIVERIALLVGQPFAAQVEALQAEQAALQARFDLLEKEANRLREERAALRDLLD